MIAPNVSERSEQITVVGAGPVGCTVAMLLVEHGYDVEMYEKRADMRTTEAAGGRSINLVLTDRGLRALKMFGLREEVLDMTVPVLGRMMHPIDGDGSFQPYGKDDTECNYSVSRDQLNMCLLDAAQRAGVDVNFATSCVGVDFEAGRLGLEHTATGDRRSAAVSVLIGADGAPSAVRQALVDQSVVDQRIDKMDYGYKELAFPAADHGSYAMADHALHIWPRGEHFLMGLANLDGSFTGTVYLPWQGPNGLESLSNPHQVREFFGQRYPGAIPVLSDQFAAEFVSHPSGTLGTVRCAPWHLVDDQMGARALLVGDAAHGIVPFFGQGLNCGLEDCLVLDDLFARHDTLSEAFVAFSATRKSDADAIADMALENFVEMSAKVADPDFLLEKAVEHRLENELTSIYRSRYAMVMYSAIPYRVAYQVGALQAELLDRLCTDIDRPEDADLDEARRFIERRMAPLYEQYDLDLSF